jgi:ribosome-associated translation inhibitor RaiA
MKVQLNTDRNIEGRDALAAHVEEVVESTLGRFGDQITRVEVHLSDENAGKGGTDDKRCVMEVRPEGRPPVTVSDQAGNLHQAIKGAAAKLLAALDSDLGRLGRRQRDSLRSPPPAE